MRSPFYDLPRNALSLGDRFRRGRKILAAEDRPFRAIGPAHTPFPPIAIEILIREREVKTSRDSKHFAREHASGCDEHRTLIHALSFL
jgi:hypothetical protein